LVPFSHTQTHNYLQEVAKQRSCDLLFVAHNDAEVPEATVSEMLRLASSWEKEGRKWGAAFTAYDAFAAYNMAAVREVGWWDWELFPSYYSDNDWYRRLTLAGWELVDTNLPCKHEGSHSIKGDKRYKFLTRVRFDRWADVYVAKWGGHPGYEQFTEPFNGQLVNPYPDE
jgi:GT2 family glycosyltransferase